MYRFCIDRAVNLMYEFFRCCTNDAYRGNCTDGKNDQLDQNNKAMETTIDGIEVVNGTYTIFSDRAICMASSRLLTPSLE
jgi:hypothetical protein